eukprot:9731497-Alexandrium_andersonii.AAC.1
MVSGSAGILANHDVCARALSRDPLRSLRCQRPRLLRREPAASLAPTAELEQFGILWSQSLTLQPCETAI